MNKADTIIIRKICNGVMIEPFNREGRDLVVDAEIIAFQNADNFVGWIRKHFEIYEVPQGVDTKEAGNNNGAQTT